MSIERILQIAKEREQLTEKFEREFYARYNQEVRKLRVVIIPGMKEIVKWISENKEKRNFILTSGQLGKKAKAEFDRKCEEIRGKTGSKHWFYCNLNSGYKIEVKTKVYIGLEKFSSIGDSMETYWSDFIQEVSVELFNNGTWRITELPIVSFESVDSDLIEIDKIDNKISELEEKRRSVLEDKFKLFNVYHYVGR